MKRHINNPYKMNWKMYGLIGGISVLIMIIAVIWNAITDSLISDIVKNLGFGCVTSTLAAFLIEGKGYITRQLSSDSIIRDNYV